MCPKKKTEAFGGSLTSLTPHHAPSQSEESARGAYIAPLGPVSLAAVWMQVVVAIPLCVSLGVRRRARLVWFILPASVIGSMSCQLFCSTLRNAKTSSLFSVLCSPGGFFFSVIRVRRKGSCTCLGGWAATELLSSALSMGVTSYVP